MSALMNSCKRGDQSFCCSEENWCVLCAWLLGGPSGLGSGFGGLLVEDKQVMESAKFPALCMARLQLWFSSFKGVCFGCLWYGRVVVEGK